MLAASALAALLGAGLVPVLHDHAGTATDVDVCALCRVSQENPHAVPDITPRPEPPAPTFCIAVERTAGSPGHRDVPARGSRDPPANS